MQATKTPPSPFRVIATAAVLVAAAAALSHFAAPAANAAPAASGLVSAPYVSVHEGVDWSRVPAAPVSTGATVGAYD